MEQKDHSSKDLSHLNVQGKVFVYFLVHATGISGASEETCKDKAKFINYFVLVALLQLKLPKIAIIQEKYFMNMTFLILILIKYKKDKTWFCFVNKG